MVRNKFGRIVSISSVAGVIGQAGSTNYAASKAGLIGMTKSIAREVGKKNVTANCIAPGFIQTDMTAVLPDAVKEGAMAFIPVKRFGNVEDVARAVAFLLQRRLRLHHRPGTRRRWRNGDVVLSFWFCRKRKAVKFLV